MLSLIGILVANVLILLLACWRAKQQLDAEAGKALVRDDLVVVDTRAALMVPLIASVGLLVMFFFGVVFWAIVAVFSLVSLYTVPFVLCKPESRRGRGCVYGANILAALLVGTWLLTGNWVVHDVLAACLITTALCFVRVNNMKDVVLLLCGLTLYDIFWVFFSSAFFGKGVMVSVATSRVGYLHPPGMVLFPVDTRGDYAILGAGDIGFPGVAMVTLLRYDYFQNANFDYTSLALVGWVMGMLVCNFVLDYTQTGQPALIYLAPGTLLPPLVAAACRGDFEKVFYGWEPQPSPPPQVPATSASASDEQARLITTVEA